MTVHCGTSTVLFYAFALCAALLLATACSREAPKAAEKAPAGVTVMTVERKDVPITGIYVGPTPCPPKWGVTCIGTQSTGGCTHFTITGQAEGVCDVGLTFSDRPAEIAGCRVTPKKQLHSGDSYGYRIERDGKTVVYSTDSEHRMEDPDEVEGFVAFFRDADLVIFDAMYSLADAMSLKEDWGHSSNVVGVELCQMARAKHLCMFHHEPIFDDEKIFDVLQETRRLEEITRAGHAVRISAAWDGMEIVV
jgi:ribonuclease BN (tRNA processing enzyme)